MSDDKIIGEIESCELIVGATANPFGGFVSSNYRTILTIAFSGGLSKQLDIEKPITIIQED